MRLALPFPERLQALAVPRRGNARIAFPRKAWPRPDGCLKRQQVYARTVGASVASHASACRTIPAPLAGTRYASGELVYRAFDERGLRRIADISPGTPDPQLLLDCGDDTRIRARRLQRPNLPAPRGNQGVQLPSAERHHPAASLNQPA